MNDAPQARSQAWATVTTLKEDPETSLTFVAHHLSSGVGEMFLFFDDPQDPVADMLEGQPGLHVFRCDATHWTRFGRRPDQQEMRQVFNAVIAYQMTRCPWIIHLDADELVHCDGAVGDMLARAQENAVRLVPWESLARPDGGKITADPCMFKRALPDTPKGREIAGAAFGDYAQCLKNGFLSHCWGKFFVRSGLAGVHLGIHAPYKDNTRFDGETTKCARLLHFHGGDFDSWAAQVRHRVTHGAYKPQYQKKILRTHGAEATLGGVLSRLLEERGEAGLRDFHRQVCSYGADKEILRSINALMAAELGLDAKREAFIKRLASSV